MNGRIAMVYGGFLYDLHKLLNEMKEEEAQEESNEISLHDQSCEQCRGGCERVPDDAISEL